jgi:hypothetical protein
MNDEKLRDFGVLAITELHVWKQGDTLVIVPMGHSNWTRMTPPVQEEGRWAVRSMLWVRKDAHAPLSTLHLLHLAHGLVPLVALPLHR